MGEGPSFSAAQRVSRPTARLVELGLPADRMVLGIGGGGARRSGMAGPARRESSASPACWRRRPSSFATSIRKASTRSMLPLPRHSGRKRRRCCSTIFRRSAACRWRSRPWLGWSMPIPDRIRGIKDSGADLAHTLALLAAVGEPDRRSRRRRAAPAGCHAGGCPGHDLRAGELGSRRRCAISSPARWTDWSQSMPARRRSPACRSSRPSRRRWERCWAMRPGPAACRRCAPVEADRVRALAAWLRSERTPAAIDKGRSRPVFWVGTLA